ncbi:bifunctional 3'-5' exonuclease/DNA polymerase [Rhodococcus globerulus]|uniref:DNA-directed DNA polymerase n=1 Tax=Rhodococcus globerulus TaxID=33008 RepID=A0ABU4C1G1_RHOGO|nr:bifunctional 3'-5' exonuclease/DNA polymerase [Rhodococcus globerulus]MDV6270340.1 bifunctional 3'-5' exonuclease/DNA polymerase [Rhodococcus globerulus]
MRVVLVPGSTTSTGAVTATVVRTDPDGTAVGDRVEYPDLVAAVQAIESAEHPRWVWPSTASVYPMLLRAGVHVQRCHDISLTRAILSMRAGQPSPPAEESDDDRLGLFDTAPVLDPDGVVAEFAEQRTVIGADARLDLLIAAESAGALSAAEMTHAGLPFSTRKHRELLEERLGPRPTGYDLPVRMQELATQISDAFGRTVNPASSVEITEAFGRQGIELPSTRKWFLQEVDHPAVPLLLRHRELAKLYSTNGWQWMDSWVRGDRFRPVYVPGGVVSGRWASRGGGALQIPKTMRSSVVADPGHIFVVADAGQLEPRILAAMSRDRRMMAAAGDDDLYALVGAEAFGGDRAKAKVAILGVLYGATAGEAKALLTLLRKRFPVAVEYVEQAAKAGERGEVVHSLLGRACPPPSPDFYSHGDAHARGRFTRNFVVQATASEWALCLLADLRRRLAEDPDGELVFFQHDEVVVHTRNPESGTAHVLAAAASATRLLFGDTVVRFPMDVGVRESYGKSSV